VSRKARRANHWNAKHRRHRRWARIAELVDEALRFYEAPRLLLSDLIVCDEHGCYTAAKAGEIVSNMTTCYFCGTRDPGKALADGRVYCYTCAGNSMIRALTDEIANLRILARPCVVLHVPARKDGDMFCALFGGDLQVGVSGWGNTPDEALDDFDRRWAAGERPRSVKIGDEICEWCDRPVNDGWGHGEGECFEKETGEPIPRPDPLPKPYPVGSRYGLIRRGNLTAPEEESTP